MVQLIIDHNTLLDKQKNHLESAVEEVKNIIPVHYDCFPKKKKEKFNMFKAAFGALNPSLT